jgi:predicted GNAT superfamily acetyltransferase
MHWTFDPLQGRNAHVNFVKLGIVCREYVRDMYGDSDSPLHRGISTDRLVATWEMDSERVVGRLAGEQWSLRATEMEPLPGILAPGVRGPFPEPGRPRLGLEGKALLLAIPAEMEPLMERDLPLAVRWREATRAAFLHYLSRGYELREFFRGAVVSHYMLALVDS